MAIGDESSEGQGIKLRLAGYHIGPEWVLESLAAFGDSKDATNIKRFQES